MALEGSASDEKTRRYSFNEELVSRLLKTGEGCGLDWRACGCGSKKLNKPSGDYSSEERALLRLTGLTGEFREGAPVIRAVRIARRYRCNRGHFHEIDSSAFICPFGPRPGRVLTHGWGPDDHGFRVPHCNGPLRPSGDYCVSVELGLDLPRQDMKTVWGCPGV